VHLSLLLACAGHSTGRVSVTAKGTIKLEYSWGPPHAGQAVEEFRIDERGRLLLHTVGTVGNETVEYTQVYTRKL
jgi:hypothetical protein